MRRALAKVALVVHDYDEAIAFFVGVLGFRLVEDSPLDNGKRWVTVSPGSPGATLLLARASDGEQAGVVGRQAACRVGFFLETDDIQRDHDRWRASGVVFEEAPRQESYGRVAVFRDLYGNRWDLIEQADRVAGLESIIEQNDPSL